MGPLHQIKVLVFKRFVWYDERAAVVANFLAENNSIRELQFLTVNDQNQRLATVFAGMQQ